MKFLFVHNNFPAQFRNLVETLATEPSYEIAAIGARGAQSIHRVDLHRYEAPKLDLSGTHPFARRFDAECWRAEQVLLAASALAHEGFTPDYIIGHCGWGETLPLRAIFPKSKLVVYCEYFYRAEGQDVHFDPESGMLGVDGIAALQCKNASTLLALAEADLGISPTRWQRSTFPREFQEKIQVVHEGIDLDRFRPDPTARLSLPTGKVLSASDEVLTFASRNLEPIRGYHIFMRALPEILRARPNVQVAIAGGDGNSYSHAPPAGRSWKTHYLDEVVAKLDLSRVHFVGPLSPDFYLRLLQVSSAHVYMSYPFVLSWSLLDAMAAGCQIIASDTAPVREVVEHGKNGALVDFHDPAGLAEAVSESLDNRDAFVARRVAARTTVAQTYDKRACVRELVRLLGLRASKAPASIAVDARSEFAFST